MNYKNDNLKQLKNIAEQYKETEGALTKERSVESTIDERCDKPSFFLWKNLQRQHKNSLSPAENLEWFDEFPEYSLAFLLESLLEKELRAFHQGLTILQSEDNKLNYCISGSISLDALKREYEQYLFAKNIYQNK